MPTETLSDLTEETAELFAPAPEAATPAPSVSQAIDAMAAEAIDQYRELVLALARGEAPDQAAIGDAVRAAARTLSHLKRDVATVQSRLAARDALEANRRDDAELAEVMRLYPKLREAFDAEKRRCEQILAKARQPVEANDARCREIQDRKSARGDVARVLRTTADPTISQQTADMHVELRETENRLRVLRYSIEQAEAATNIAAAIREQLRRVKAGERPLTVAEPLAAYLPVGLQTNSLARLQAPEVERFAHDRLRVCEHSAAKLPALKADLKAAEARLVELDAAIKRQLSRPLDPREFKLAE